MNDTQLQELQDKSTATFSAKVLADSVNPWGDRLTTFELIYPRCIHSEIMTHRLFSRNAASSRAIPLEKSIKAVEETPFIPFHWGKNQSGMQAYAEKTGWDKSACRAAWYGASRQAVTAAYRLRYLELHKQIANRILEPFMFISVVLSTTSFRHFELLRNHETDVIHNPDTGGTWIQDLDTYAALYPRSGKELLLCVKLRTQPVRKGEAG